MKTSLKYKIAPLAFILCSAFANAQQNSLYNTYSLDPLQLNIAYAGAACAEADLHYRTQWIGLKQTPKSFQFNAHTALGKSNGLGLRVNSQSMGLLNNLGATVGYSYRFNVNQDAKVHLGVGVGWSQATLNSQKAVVIDNANDVTLNNSNRQTANGFDSEFGAMLIGKKIKAGISALHLYNSNPDFSGSGSYKVLPQLNTQVSYVLNKDQKIEVEPWLLSRYTLKGANVLEGIVNVNLMKVVSVGAGYRTNYGVIFLVGARIGGIKLGYSFDYGSGKNATNLGTSHQIMLGFNTCKATKTPLPVEEEAPPVTATRPTVMPKIVADLDPHEAEEPKPIKADANEMNPIKEEFVSFEGVLKAEPGGALKNKKIKALNDKGEVIGETVTNNAGAFAFRSIPANLNFIVAVSENDASLPEGSKISLTNLSGKEVRAFVKEKEGVNFKVLASEKKLIEEMKAEDASLAMGISGRLLDENEKPVSNLLIKIKEENSPVEVKAQSNKYGVFNFANLNAEKNYLFEVDEKDPALAGLSQLKIANSKGKIYKVIDLKSAKPSFKLLDAEKNALGEFKVEDADLSAAETQQEVPAAVEAPVTTPKKEEPVVATPQKPAVVAAPKKETAAAEVPVRAVSVIKPMTPEMIEREDAVVKMNNLAEEVVFGLNKAQLDEAGLKKIDRVVEIIGQTPGIKINIVGYTCNKGTKASNDLISVRRATYVRNELIKRGVNPRSINRSIGLGADISLYDNSKPETQLKNRTVRFESVN